MREKLSQLLTKNAALAALFAFLCILFAVEKAFPQIEEKTDAYFESSITQAATVFATARAVNAGVSVLKESSLSGAPAGIGVDVALGQVLDPVDDVVERLSDILFTTIVSLGIQKVIYEMIGAAALFVVSGLLVCAFISEFFVRNEKWKAVNAFFKKAALLVLLVRAALPCTALAAEAIEANFFTPRIEAAQQRLAMVNSEATIEVKFDWSDDDGMLDIIEKAWGTTKDAVVSVKEKLSVFISNAGDIISTSLDIAGLYVALFIVQVIFLPLMSFYLIAKLANRLFAVQVPVVLALPNKTENAKKVES